MTTDAQDSQDPGPPPVRRGIASFLLLAAIVAAACYLLRASPTSNAWQQGYDPTGHWWFSTLLASLPLVLLLGAMAVFRLKAHTSALIGLAAALAIAIGPFHMPLRLALESTFYGAGYGLFPICWIILPVIFLYQLTVKTGSFTALQQSLTNITEDGRLQLLLIAFALGAFFEGTSGFGTPVAVCGAILVSLGFKPMEAAGLSLVANTAPVAFGALGIPVVTLAEVTGLDTYRAHKDDRGDSGSFLPARPVLADLGLCRFQAHGRSLARYPGRRRYLRNRAIRHGDCLRTIAGRDRVVLFNHRCADSLFAILEAEARGQRTARRHHRCGSAEVQAHARPHLQCVASLAAPQPARVSVGAPTACQAYGSRDNFIFPDQWPAQGRATRSTRCSQAGIRGRGVQAELGNSNGHRNFCCGNPVRPLDGARPKALLVTFAQTLFTIRFTVLTIAAMLALGFVTRYSGLDATMGLAFARTGFLYPFFGTLVGWLGTATTGSDTSSNVLFGSLQKLTAQQIGVSPILMASANSAGGVMGKMVAAQSIVVASTATQQYGIESSILRFVFWHSLALATLAAAFVFMLAYVYPFRLLVIH